MERDLAILLARDEADRKSAPQFAARGLVANPAVQARPYDMQLGLAHGALEAEQQSVVEHSRMIDAIGIADEGVSEAAEIEQAIPVGVVAGEAGDFEAEHDPDVAEGYFGDKPGEAASLNDAGSRNPEVFVNDADLLRRPAQRGRLGNQCILTFRGLSIVCDL